MGGRARRMRAIIDVWKAELGPPLLEQDARSIDGMM